MSPHQPGVEISPSDARRLLGELLRRVREGAGLNLKDASAAIERSAPTLSRLENGRIAAPRSIEVQALLNRYHEVDVTLVDAQVRDLATQYIGQSHRELWFDRHPDLTSADKAEPLVRQLMEHEVFASEIRTYEATYIPGLLQTPGYTTAVARMVSPNQPESEYRRTTEFRKTRQDVALGRTTDSENPLRLSVIIDEVALRRVPGGVEIQRAQLTALLPYIRGQHENCFVRVVPLAVATAATTGGPFVIYSFPATEQAARDDAVYVESRTGGVYLTEVAKTQVYNDHFDSLRDVALSPADAENLIAAINSGAD